jgi:type II secretory pathway pseudopilin PulG
MKKQGGFTYLGALLAIALLGIGLSLVAEVWATTARRQRMEQLEWVGQQFSQAIGSYYESTPGPVKAYPKSLQELLDDRRTAFARRHLRQLYVDPFTGTADWEVLRTPDGGIHGVRVVIRGVGGQAGALAREYIYPKVVPPNL